MNPNEVMRNLAGLWRDYEMGLDTTDEMRDYIYKACDCYEDHPQETMAAAKVHCAKVSDTVTVLIMNELIRRGRQV